MESSIAPSVALCSFQWKNLRHTVYNNQSHCQYKKVATTLFKISLFPFKQSAAVICARAAEWFQMCPWGQNQWVCCVSHGSFLWWQRSLAGWGPHLGLCWLFPMWPGDLLCSSAGFLHQDQPVEQAVSVVVSFKKGCRSSLKFRML